MEPYEFINHILEDIIAECYNDNYCFLYFDNVRYDNDGDFFETSVLDKSFTGCRHLGGVDVEAVESWVYHNNRWISTTDINPYLGGVALRNKYDFNFYNHSFEPIYLDFDSKFYNHILKKRSLGILLHSEYNSWDIVQLEKQGIKNVHWFSHAYLCSEFYFKHYQKLKMVTDYKTRPVLHRWICTNRLIDIPRDYRIRFLNLLDISKGVYSLLDKDPYTNKSLKEIYYDNKVKPNSFDHHGNDSAEIKIHELTPWNTSFLHIVNETIWQDKIHFTEKVFKPIVLHQPFVVLQAPGSLAYLRSYGFKTFGDFWDEGYDTIEDPQQRMQAIADIVNTIGAKSLEELETMRMEMASVLEHNFRHFYENIPAICLDELRKGIATL